MSDPHVHIFNGTAVMYASHDAGGVNSTFWDMPDWHVWTSPNLLNWTLARVIKPVDTWMGNGTCFATDGQERNGYYYFYFSNKSTNIGVLRAKTPTGPFEDVLNKPLVPSGLTDDFHYDPTILTDNDEARTPYIVYGRRSENKGTPYYIAKLNDDMLHLAEAPRALVFKGAMPYRDKPTLHKRQGVYYLSSGDAYSTASNVYGPYTYRGKTGAGGSHGRFFTWNGQWFRGFVVQVHAPWIQPTVPFWRDSWMTYVHYRANGEMVDDVGFLNASATPVLPGRRPEKVWPDGIQGSGVGQYNASWPRIEAEWYMAGSGTEKLEMKAGGFAVRFLASGSYLAFPNTHAIPARATLALHVLDYGSGQRIEMHQHSATGPLVANCTTNGAGGGVDLNETNATATTVNCTMQCAGSTADLYLVVAARAHQNLILDSMSITDAEWVDNRV
jgi:hypothetical protein